jgi:hypothetical protein
MPEWIEVDAKHGILEIRRIHLASVINLTMFRVKGVIMKCPEHGVAYQIVKTSYEQYGVILKDVKGLQCPVDGEELFTMEQSEAIRNRIASLSPRLKLIRKITRAENRPRSRSISS